MEGIFLVIMLKNILLISLTFLASCSSGSTPAVIDTTEKQEKTILALGDSLTAGYGLPESDAYPKQLETKLQTAGYNYTVINAGISGDTTAGLLSRLDWILDGETPNLAILCIGANDAFQWKDPAEIEKNIREIIVRLQAKDIPILLAGMRAPLNLGPEYAKKYEAIFPSLAKEYRLFYMDFFLEWVALQANLNQEDRIHPTKEWYAIVVENLMRILVDEGMVGR